LSLFESGEILLYLAEKTGKLLSGELRERHHTCNGSSGRRAGWAHAGTKSSFYRLRPAAHPLRDRTLSGGDAAAVWRAAEPRLEKTPWLGGDHYSIADIACWPWVNTHEKHRIDLALTRR
jgi:GST-like protein